MQPANAVAAATHADPYPYYASLRAGPALRFDAELKLWIAARAEAVMAVMDNPDCRVRPVAEAVPRAIVGAASGEIFGLLVRMNEGEKTHQAPRLALARALAALDPALVERRAAAVAAALARQLDLSSGAGLDAYVEAMPVSVVASLLGFPDHELPRVASWMRDFVRCLSPLSSPAQLADAASAAAALLARFEALLAAAPDPASLAGQVRREAEALGWSDARALLANLIGLLSQTFEATAGLLGNGLIACWREGGAPAATLAALAALVAETARFDPAIQNTRRFVARATRVAGTDLAAGDAVLLCLAAASRDPVFNAEPERFMLARQTRRLFGFGHGPHACPGQALAQRIATAGLRELARLPARDWGYRPSVNARIPGFSSAFTGVSS